MPDAVHKDILGGHEGQLRVQMLGDNGGVDFHAPDNVDIQVQNRVGGQKKPREWTGGGGRVVQRPLKPLGGGGDGGILQVAYT